MEGGVEGGGRSGGWREEWRVEGGVEGGGRSVFTLEATSVGGRMYSLTLNSPLPSLPHAELPPQGGL